MFTLQIRITFLHFKLLFLDSCKFVSESILVVNILIAENFVNTLNWELKLVSL